MRLTIKSCSISVALLLSLLTQSPLGATPAVVSATPSSGIGFMQTFTLAYSDTSGYASLTSLQVLFNTSTASGANACYVGYSMAGNWIVLLNDAGNGWSSLAPLGSGGTVQNSQCSVNATSSSSSGSGNNFTLTLVITFSSAFAGTKTIYMNASDNGGGTNWLPKGTWTVGTPSVPSNVSVTPSSGTGLSQPFTFVYSDTGGYTNLAYAEMNFSSPLSGPNSCDLVYVPAGNYISMVNDAGNSWSSGATPGSSGTLQNSQCSVNVAASSASGSGNNLTLQLSITFSSSFAGAKSAFMLAADNDGLLSQWQTEGAWTVGASTPSSISVAPSSGTGLIQPFTLVYSDSGGYGNLAWTQVLFSSTQNGFNACYVYYQKAGNYIALDGDNNTWSGSAAVGSGGILQNSQCSVNATNSSVSGSGNTLTLNLAITFFSSFAGAKNTYMIAGDADGIVSQLQPEGTWTVGVPPAPDFTITTHSALDPLPIDPGSSNFMNVAVSAVGGFVDTVNLDVRNLPIGSSWHWQNPSIPNGSGSAILFIDKIPTNTATGKYLVTVIGLGYSTGLSHVTQFTLQVNGPPAYFTMTGSGYASAPVGGTASYNVFVTAQSGFTGAVALSVSGQPTNWNVGCTPSCTITLSGPATVSATVTITSLGNAVARTYLLAITGTASTWRQDLPETLVLNPVTGQPLSVSPSTADMTANQVQQFTASIGGSNAPVTWAVSSPNGAVAGTLNISGTNTASYTAPATVAGNQIIIITATSQADNVTRGTAQIRQRTANSTYNIYNDNMTRTFYNGYCSPSCSGVSCSVSPQTDIAVTTTQTSINYFNVMLTADTNAVSGSRTLTCAIGSAMDPEPLMVWDTTPNITGISPNPISYPGTTPVTFTGSGFGVAPPTLTLNGVNCSAPGGFCPITQNNPTSFTASVTPPTAGTYSAQVTSSGNGGNDFGGPSQSQRQSQPSASTPNLIAAQCPAQPVTIVRDAQGAPIHQPSAVINSDGTRTIVGQLTASLPGGGALPSGASISWSSDNPSMVSFDSPSLASTVVRFRIAGKTTITATLTNPCGQSAADQFTYVVTDLVTAVSWVDGSDSAIPPPPAPDTQSLLSLTDSRQCATTLAGWYLAGANFSSGNFTANDRMFANTTLIKGSADLHPPGTISGNGVRTGAYWVDNSPHYRMYNEFQVAFELTNFNTILNPTDLSSTFAPVPGVTPEPCSNFQMFSLAVENQSQPMKPSTLGTLVSKLAETRVGSVGQAVNYYINWTPGRSNDMTPWIWTSIQFNANGNWLPFVVQGTPVPLPPQQFNSLSMFPSTASYSSNQGTLPFLNGGNVTQNYPQFPLATFIALDSTYQYPIQ